MDRAPASGNLSFRSAVAADAVSIVSLVESAYRGDASRIGWTTEAELLDGQRTDLDAVLEMVADANTTLLLAEGGGQLLACCLLRRDAAITWFGLFSVVPALQGSGVGSRVMTAAEANAAGNSNTREMRMTVIDCRHELIAWYERRGYRRTGEKLPFPYGNPRFGIPRRDDLRFEVLAKPLRGGAA